MRGKPSRQHNIRHGTKSDHHTTTIGRPTAAQLKMYRLLCYDLGQEESDKFYGYDPTVAAGILARMWRQLEGTRQCTPRFNR